MLYKMENPATKVKQIQSEAFELFKRKNQQYGNAFAKHRTVGVMIRMGEKINRFLSVSRLKIELKDEEALIKRYFIGFIELFLYGYNVIG